jgi:hypothetical protein
VGIGGLKDELSLEVVDIEEEIASAVTALVEIAEEPTEFLVFAAAADRAVAGEVTAARIWRNCGLTSTQPSSGMVTGNWTGSNRAEVARSV